MCNLISKFVIHFNHVQFDLKICNHLKLLSCTGLATFGMVGGHTSTSFPQEWIFLTSCLLFGNICLQLSTFTVRNPVVKTKFFLLYIKPRSCKSHHNFNLTLSVLNNYFSQVLVWDSSCFFLYVISRDQIIIIPITSQIKAFYTLKDSDLGFCFYFLNLDWFQIALYTSKVKF